MKRRKKWRRPIEPNNGERVRVECPFSEVCCHMNVAGTEMLAELVTEQGGTYPMVQLYSLDGEMFSFPITTGEAGVYHASDGSYFCYTTEKPAACAA
jgi:hypothetical protein